MALAAGAPLGPYEILSALGAGGMGEVYKARDTRLDRIVAIKVLPKSLAADPQFRERFDREARTISLERHVGRVLSSKTEAQEVAEGLKASIRQGRLHETPVATTPQHSGDISFETFGEIFVERFSKAREKVSWYDDASMLRQLMAFPIRWSNATRLGEKPLGAIGEDDLEAFLRHLHSLGRTVATRNHYVQLMRTMSRWSVRKGYRTHPFVLDDSDMIRRKKAGKRNRRLEPGEEEKLLAAVREELVRPARLELATSWFVG